MTAHGPAKRNETEFSFSESIRHFRAVPAVISAEHFQQKALIAVQCPEAHIPTRETTLIIIFSVMKRMDKVPVYDNHLHMSPSGRNVDALMDFKKAGGTGLTLITLPYEEVPITKGEDFAKSYEITYRLAALAEEKTGLEINIAVGPYPLLLMKLAGEGYSVEKAEAILMRGMEDAGKAVAEGKACAIGEVGRPHFECDPAIREACNRVLSYGMELAKENSCPIIIHCESGTTETNRNLSNMARAVGLDPGLVVKHSSPPFVTLEETYGVMPSIPASKKLIKQALAKDTDRFMIETDYIDDLVRPGAVMAVNTVPNKVTWMLGSGVATEEQVCRICGDIPNSLYRR